MITDEQLNRLAIFLGSLAMLLIVLYHFLEVNAQEDDSATVKPTPGEKIMRAKPAVRVGGAGGGGGIVGGAEKGGRS